MCALTRYGGVSVGSTLIWGGFGLEGTLYFGMGYKGSVKEKDIAEAYSVDY